MVSRPEIVAYKANAAVVFLVNLSLSLFVESRCGAVTLGDAYLWPPLSSGGASIA